MKTHEPYRARGSGDPRHGGGTDVRACAAYDGIGDALRGVYANPHAAIPDDMSKLLDRLI